MAESRCDTNAVSAVGARGLVQLMPGTSRDMARKLGEDPFTSPHVAKFAIPAGAAYMAQMDYQWRRNRSPLESHALGTASYNRGVGNIVKDQAECGGAKLWSEVSPCTRRHTREPVDYVERIWRYWQQMETGR